jgi:hypothetical protein
MVPLNSTIIEQICHLLLEQIRGTAYHDDILEDMQLISDAIVELDNSKELLMTNIHEQAALFDVNTIDQVSEMDDILELMDKMCTLPINGKQIRQYIKDLEKTQRDTIRQENHVILPTSAQSSTLMQRLRTIVERE